jgi:hypothetical protein
LVLDSEESTIRHILEYHVDVLGVMEDTIETYDVRMTKGRVDLDLSNDLKLAGISLDDILLHHLQSHHISSPLLLSQKHLPVPPLTQLCSHLKVLQPKPLQVYLTPLLKRILLSTLLLQELP